MDLQKLKEALDKVAVKGLGPRPEYNEVDKFPPTFVRDGQLFVSGEMHDSFYFCDYYGEHRDNVPWVCRELEKFAIDHQCYWEWESPACIVLVEI